MDWIWKYADLQKTFNFSKSSIETLGKGMNYVLSLLERHLDDVKTLIIFPSFFQCFYYCLHWQWSHINATEFWVAINKATWVGGHNFFGRRSSSDYHLHFWMGIMIYLVPLGLYPTKCSFIVLLYVNRVLLAFDTFH